MNNQRFYATARTAAVNNGWRNKASVIALGTTVLGFSLWNAKEVNIQYNVWYSLCLTHM